ncbi:hypothetical protein PRIPAC_92928 [Pristionchus pacificus]|uniref:Uncharacterized protein n=1 Tax=Pristionchus pacificus TaxID=54126 RepID=A0A2A6BQ55_PRIPA|nr:hypothetical protein PRIPAC_92928 [Pristionchus pacificus]|eukprot:PDM68059.1 hypothetical protein PRIPAC_46103 [Pristionchus pacificus]
MTHMIMNGFTIIPRSLFYVYKPLRDRTSSFGINIELTANTTLSLSEPHDGTPNFQIVFALLPISECSSVDLKTTPIIAHLAQLT